MTSQEIQRNQELRAAAQRDISDIDALSKNDPFNRYFVGRMNQLYHEEVELALTATTEELRTKSRHRAVLLRELTQMPAKHRQSAEQFLQRPASPQEVRPIQVG